MVPPKRNYGKTWAWAQMVVLGVLLSLSAVRCGNRASGSSEFSEGSSLSCYAGMIRSSDGRTCLYPGYCGPGQGFDPSLNKCVAGDPFYGYGDFVAYGNSLSITNKAQFRRLLEDYTQGCSGTSFYIQLIGINPYDALTNSGYVDIRMPSLSSGTAQVVIAAGATSPEAAFYSNNYPMYFTASVASTTTTSVVWQVNSSVGACANFGGGAQLQIFSDTQGLKSTTGGKTEYIDAYVAYRGVIFARVRLKAY